MSIKGSRTSENLLKAFQVNHRRATATCITPRVAQKNGYEHIAGIFTETADNEKAHAKLFLRHLINNGMKGETIISTALSCRSG